HGRAARIRVRGPVDGPRPRAPELSGTPGLDEQQERWSRQQRVPPHPVDGHAEDHERVEERPRDPGDHRHDRRFGHRGPHQRGPPREPPRVRRDEGPGHARRALDRDAPGVLEVLEQCFMDEPNPVRPLFVPNLSAERHYPLGAIPPTGLNTICDRSSQRLAHTAFRPETEPDKSRVLSLKTVGLPRTSYTSFISDSVALVLGYTKAPGQRFVTQYAII